MIYLHLRSDFRERCDCAGLKDARETARGMTTSSSSFSSFCSGHTPSNFGCHAFSVRGHALSGVGHASCSLRHTSSSSCPTS